MVDQTAPAWFLRDWSGCSLAVMGAGFFEEPRGRVARRRPRDHWTFSSVLAGELELAGPVPLRIVEGHAFLAPPEHGYVERSTSRGQGVRVFIANVAIAPPPGTSHPLHALRLPRPVPLRERAIHERDCTEVAGCFRNWRPRDGAARIRSRPAIDRLVSTYLLDGFALGCFPDAVDMPRWLADLGDWIVARCRHVDLGLEDIARAAGFSPAYVCRMFARHYGRTPMTHLREARMRTAMHLLRSTRGRSVASIAASSGYRDTGLFWRHVRRASGFSPTRLRRGGGAGGG